MCSRWHVTTRLSPVSLLTRFLTQPEVKFHVFKWLKHGDEKFFSLFISEPQVGCNKKIKKHSVIGTLTYMYSVHVHVQVEQVGYWPRARSRWLHIVWDLFSLLVYGPRCCWGALLSKRKKERKNKRRKIVPEGQYPAILTKQACYPNKG